MKLGIAKTLETIGDLKVLAVDGIRLAKTGPFGLSLFTSLLKVVADVKELIADAPAALPELTDLDATEAGQVGSAAYDLVAGVIAAVVA